MARVLRENAGCSREPSPTGIDGGCSTGSAQAGSEYRRILYAEGVSGRRRELSAEELVSFCELTLSWVDHTIRANRRPDGMYHAYNLMSVAGDAELSVRRLTVMLEGQVAVLSSGLLSPTEALDLLDALARSDLYREDQHSYVLYPDRELPRFLEKNVVPREAVAESALLSRMLERGDRRIVEADVTGAVHFAPALRNGRLLKEALATVSDDDGGSLARRGRAGGAGSVRAGLRPPVVHRPLGHLLQVRGARLHLLAHGLQARAGGAGEPPGRETRRGPAGAVVDGLRRHYEAIREGLGVHDAPPAYGAFPTDPYSHTPGFAGVQQPGMTGQVKEDLLSRLGEMGVRVEEGRLRFEGLLLGGDELLDAPATFRYVDLSRERAGPGGPRGGAGLHALPGAGGDPRGRRAPGGGHRGGRRHPHRRASWCSTPTPAPRS